MRAVAFIGYKSAGKTWVLTGVLRKLIEKGYRVAAIKHMAHPPSLPEDKDLTRIYRAGVAEVIGIHESMTIVYKSGSEELSQVLSKLNSYDFVLIEGFKNFYGPRIAVVKTIDEALKFQSPLNMAYVGPFTVEESKELSSVLKAPILGLNEIDKITDIILKKSFHLPAGLNCGKCKYGNCTSLAEAIARGDASIDECVSLNERAVRIKVDGVTVPLNPFMRRLYASIIEGLVKPLKGVSQTPSRVVIEVDLTALRS
ncbi:MAG: molybdopterin-guanine dinucleotide biosynthesis protein B [Thermoprotei archaeon]|nr:MAG: molybdopterin-guanine dinucleotide biosynthesis protein B [Thermoprotei archaeon]